MSAHMKKHLTKVMIGDEKFNLRSKEVKTLLSLVKIMEKSYSPDKGNANWSVVYKENFGNMPEWALCLRSARQKKNLSQKELSKKCQIPITTISKYENGERKISESQAKKLAKALQTHFRLFLIKK